MTSYQNIHLAYDTIKDNFLFKLDNIYYKTFHMKQYGLFHKWYVIIRRNYTIAAIPNNVIVQSRLLLTQRNFTKQSIHTLCINRPRLLSLLRSRYFGSSRNGCGGDYAGAGSTGSIPNAVCFLKNVPYMDLP